MAFGTYPEISLADARERRNAARKLVANGVDPSEAKKAEKIAIELLKFPFILKKFPKMGTKEQILEERPENFRFLLFDRTERITVKILYYVDYERYVIYITDFFPSEMLNKKIKKRN
jgi:hypothetical protein